MQGAKTHLRAAVFAALELYNFFRRVGYEYVFYDILAMKNRAYVCSPLV